MGYKLDYETFRQEVKKLVEEGLQEKGDYSCPGSRYIKTM